MVLLRKVPGMTIFAPSSYQELGVMLHDALDLCAGPAAIRWPKTAAPSVGPDEVGSGLDARLVRRGTDVCIIGAGKMLAAATEAAEALEAEGVSVTVWDPRVVKPFDDAMVDDALEHPVVVTVEDGLADGGVGSAFADELAPPGPRRRPQDRRAGRARPVHPPRQARRHPGPARPRRRRHRQHRPRPPRLIRRPPRCG